MWGLIVGLGLRDHHSGPGVFGFSLGLRGLGFRAGLSGFRMEAQSVEFWGWDESVFVCGWFCTSRSLMAILIRTRISNAFGMLFVWEFPKIRGTLLGILLFNVLH